jgi:hypothetical protein
MRFNPVPMVMVNPRLARGGDEAISVVVGVEEVMVDSEVWHGFIKAHRRVEARAVILRGRRFVLS